MRVKVRLYASLRSYLPGMKIGDTTELEIQDGACIADLFRELHIPREIVKMSFVNGISREPDFVLNADDQVGIFPPIGGG